MIGRSVKHIAAHLLSALLILNAFTPAMADDPPLPFFSVPGVSSDAAFVSSDTIPEEAQAEEAADSVFPESYSSKLDALKEKHPAWVFVRKDIGIKWADALSSQLQGNRSWIEKDAGDAYVDKNSPKGGNWYLATEAGVGHFMDPRTYLDESHIFAFETLDYNSSFQTPAVVGKLLSSTFMSGNIEGTSTSYAAAFCEIGADSSVSASPLFLASRVIQEQGKNGGGNLISGTYSGYEGYYNYYNIGATGTGEAAARNGLIYAGTAGDYLRPWDTRYKSLKGGAQYIAGQYIKKGQDTLYFQKFNVVYEPYYGHQYMQNIRAPYYEAASVAKGYSGAGITDEAFVFEIPVYSDMPDIGEDPGEKEEEKDVSGVELSLDVKELSLKRGQKYRLLPTVKQKNTALSYGSIEYSSSDSSVVKTDRYGFITALAASAMPVTVSVSVKGHPEICAGCSVSVSDCLVTWHDSSGDVLATTTAEYGSDISDAYYGNASGFDGALSADQDTGSISADSAGEPYGSVSDDSLCFAGWFAGENGSGIRLYADSIVTGDMDVYPCLTRVKQKGLTIMPVGDQTYTGEAIKPPVAVYYNGKRLLCGTDYRLSYRSNKKAGEATVIINGKKSFGDTVMVGFRIVPAQADYNMFSMYDAYRPDRGKTVYAKPVMRYLGRNMKKGVDYELSYPAGSISGAYTDAGIYPVKAKLYGNFKGELVSCQVIAPEKPAIYAPSLTVKGASVSSIRDIQYSGQGAAAYLRPGKLKISAKNGNILKKNTDFVLSYKNDVAPGKAVMTVRGIGAYKGTVVRKYKILR